jgi:hypothetical protein
LIRAPEDRSLAEGLTDGVRRKWLHSRIVHDLRRSDARHVIHAGVDPHTVMAFPGDRADSMLIALDELRRAAERRSDYTDSVPESKVIPLAAGTHKEGAE